MRGNSGEGGALRQNYCGFLEIWHTPAPPLQGYGIHIYGLVRRFTAKMARHHCFRERGEISGTAWPEPYPYNL